MRIGSFDRRVTIQRATVTQSASGAPSESWAVLFTCWARVTYPGGRELFQSGQVQGQQDALFRIRWRSDYTPADKDRIAYDGRTYDIVSVAEVGRHEAWDIVAKARNV